ncbi:MAG: nucleotide exchange factor GrpE [Gammaproteobacteria bacterium]|nr:MAG: nucleotide exchange factor GrpE [Gammaproteobacteria bacterium]
MEKQEEIKENQQVEEETSSEKEDSRQSEDLSEASVEELLQKLEEANARAEEHLDRLLRAQAELDNQRKRAERDIENAHKYALEKFVNELLAVKDSLELGIQAAKGESVDAEKILEGTELTDKMLTQVLQKFGVEEINPQGEKFDPELHQAMSMQPSDEYPANTVMQVVQKGYTLNGRLVRPAMVIVSQGKGG